MHLFFCFSFSVSIWCFSVFVSTSDLLQGLSSRKLQKAETQWREKVKSVWVCHSRHFDRSQQEKQRSVMAEFYKAASISRFWCHSYGILSHCHGLLQHLNTKGSCLLWLSMTQSQKHKSKSRSGWKPPVRIQMKDPGQVYKYVETHLTEQKAWNFTSTLTKLEVYFYTFSYICCAESANSGGQTFWRTLRRTGICSDPQQFIDRWRVQRLLFNFWELSLLTAAVIRGGDLQISGVYGMRFEHCWKHLGWCKYTTQ